MDKPVFVPMKDEKTEVQYKSDKINLDKVTVGTKDDIFYFVVARTTLGGRFYSETVDDEFKAIDLYKRYISTTEYFGGGEVELFSISPLGYDIVSKIAI